MKNSPPVVVQKTIVLKGQWPVMAQLADHTGLSTEAITDAAAKGAIWWSAAQARDKYKKPRRVRTFDSAVENGISEGDQVLINYNSQVLAAEAALPVLVSDQVNYSVWCKPGGVLSQGTKWSDHCSMPFLVQQVHGKPAFLVHRLDRAASGLMILAHTKNATVKLCNLFETRRIGKTYQAVVNGRFSEKIPFKIESDIDGKSASSVVIHCAPMTADGKSLSLLTINIKTGRKHQIRSHLSSSGYSIVGDRLFDSERVHEQDLQLVSTGLEFNCPFTRESINVQLPGDLNILCNGDP